MNETWPFQIEAMTVEDVPSVSAIERMVFTRPWPAEAYHYEITENPRSRYLVARLKAAQVKPRHGMVAALRRAMIGPDLDRSLLGYGGLWMMVDEAHICTLAVHPAWRKRHIGEALLAALVAQAMELAASVVTLEVRVSNTAAQHLYEKYGFTRAGVRKRYYSDNNEDAYIMTTPAIDSAAFVARFAALRQALDSAIRAEWNADAVTPDEGTTAMGGTE